MIGRRIDIPKRHLLTFFGLFLFSAFLCNAFWTQEASAAYRAGNLTDNAVFLDANSMNQGQIQGFLNSMEGQIASKTFSMNCDLAGQQAKQIYVSIGAPCGGTATSAQIIYYAAQVYGISPKVIIATIQKEQSLITAKNPTQRQYGQVMGYSCPTSGECDGNSNFLWQVDNGTWALRYHYERARGNNTWWNNGSWGGSGCGGDTKYRKPNAYPGQNVRFYDEGDRHYATVFIENAATSSFYCYTPHVFNNFPGCIAAWGVPYTNWRPTIGNTGNCYSGSYNYVTAFESWFGSVHANVITPLNIPRWMQLKSDTYKYSYGDNQAQGPLLSRGRQIYFPDKFYSNGQWYLRTQFSRDTGGLEGIPLSDLEEIPTQAISPRWMSVRATTAKIDPVRVQTYENVDAMRAVKVLDTISVNDTLYYRTEYENANDSPKFLAATSLENFKFYNFITPRTLYTKKATNKINVQTGATIQNIAANTFLSFDRRITIDGILYAQLSNEHGTLHAVSMNDLEEIDQLPFVSLDNPRVMQLTTDSYKKRLPGATNYGPLLAAGRRIYFPDKVLINGKWYLRTQWDKDMGNHDGIPLEALTEIN